MSIIKCSDLSAFQYQHCSTSLALPPSGQDSSIRVADRASVVDAASHG